MRPLVLVLAGLALAACGSSPPSRLYVLSPTASEADAPEHDAATDVVVRIAHVALPRYATGPAIVTRRSPTHVKQATFDLWGEPLEEGFARTLRTDLARLLPGAHVVVEFLEAPEPDHHLMVFVERFDVDADGVAWLEARWGLTGPVANAGAELHETRLSRPVEGGTVDDQVRALSATVGDLAREIAGAVRDAR